MTAAIVGIFVFVMINSFDCLDDLKANTDDMDEEEAATNLGKKFKSAPWGMFKVVITLIFGAIAVTQLWKFGKHYLSNTLKSYEIVTFKTGKSG